MYYTLFLVYNKPKELIILQITTLIENHSHSALLSEHGLALYIDDDDEKILFDLGKSDRLFTNAKELAIDLSQIKKVIISHAHYDHSGGFIKLNQVNKDFTLMVKNTFFQEKYKLKDGNYIYNGIPFKKEDVSELHYVKNLEQITNNLYIVTDFKTTNGFEKVNYHYYIKKANNYILDNFSDEIALVYKSKKGLFLIVACSHKGIINILESVKSNFSKPIVGIIGGIHLKDASSLRQEKTLLELQKYPLELLALSHCTGDIFMNKLKLLYPEKFIYNDTGNIINLD